MPKVYDYAFAFYRANFPRRQSVKESVISARRFGGETMKRKMWAKEVLNCEPLVINNIDYENLPKNQKEWYFRVFITDEDPFKNVRSLIKALRQDSVFRKMDLETLLKHSSKVVAEELTKDLQNFDSKEAG